MTEISQRQEWLSVDMFGNIHNILSLDTNRQEEFAEVFRSQLEPLYGSQDNALDKIFNIRDRAANVIINDIGSIAGVLVYKNNPVDEHGLVNALEIKTLMLINPEENGGRGYGAMLLREAEDVALNISAQSIMVTVAADKPESQSFFMKHGFSVWGEINDAYRKGNVETIFEKEVSYSDPI